jgi:hypothetical protein
MFENKKVVHKYIVNCKTVDLAPGLGDFLRGSLYLHQLSQKMGFELIIDFSSHPIGKWTLQQQTQDLQQIQDSDTRELFNENMCMTEQYIQQTAYPILICHNWPSRPLDSVTKEFLQKSILFNKSFQAEYEDEIKRLKLPEQYCLIHVRTGDRNSLSIPENMDQYIMNHIIPKWNRNVVVMSDNYKIKEYVTNKYNFYMTDWHPVHLGGIRSFPIYDNGSHNINDDDIKHTLMEFLIISKCKSIYAWPGSGFAFICSLIYDIPYKDSLSDSVFKI